MAIWRTGFAGLLAVAVWFLSVYALTPPAARGPSAPATEFSAARALGVLARLQGPAKPHPAGSAENAAVHARLTRELAALGVKATPFTRMACFSGARWNAMECAEVTDLIAEVVPGRGKVPGKAILMMAHMDSVPAGPGAGDDGAGVATILETIRALKARGGGSAALGHHPILALFTDGEEYGLLGAAAFVRDPAWRARVGIAINMEGRGSRGRSLLFQTSPGNRALIDLYARAVPRYASSSLNAEVYRFLPNDTDFTPFLNAGLTGYNFAFVGGVENYHTPHDTIANLDPRTVQSHGDNLLGLVTALQGTDFAALKSGDAAYLDVLGVALPRLPAALMLPLSLLLFAAIAFIGWRGRKPDARRLHRLRAAVMPLVLLLGCLGAGFALHFIAAAVSGDADPSFAHPAALRLSLAFGVWAAALLASRLGGGAITCWLWLAGLGIVTAALLPGISPFFVFPVLIAALCLPFAAARPALLILPSLAALIVWIGILVQGEELLGLAGHPLFTVPAAFALVGLVPLLPRLERCDWLYGWGASAALAVLLSVIAGLIPSHTQAKPLRLNLHYVEQDGHAFWAADPQRPFPPGLRAIFSGKPRQTPLGSFVTAPAGAPRFAAPTAQVTRNGDKVTITLHGSDAADAMLVIVPKEAALSSVALGDWHFAASGRFIVSCATAACRNAGIVLGLKSNQPVRLTIAEQRFGLPPDGANLIAARGNIAVPSQFGDSIMVAAVIKVPAR